MRDAIFVSYSHADATAIAELQTALDRVGPDVNVTVWNDSRISPASRWREEIDEALSTAAAAVLLVSQAFCRSDFIRMHELPALMKAAGRGELDILAVVLDECDHHLVTGTFQAVNDPLRPLMTLSDDARRRVWERLAGALAAVAARIDDEMRIGAEVSRVARDAASAPDVARIIDKIARARVDPAFDGADAMRENTLVFLEGQLCQAQATWLIEASKRTDLSPARSKAIVRLLEDVARREELALRRATELTQLFADETLARLNEAKHQSS